MPHLPDHGTHDLELVAAYAAGDATGASLDTAAALVAGCAECAALHRDLRAIAAAVGAMPAPVRTRDFRLSEQDAASLHPSGWRGIVALLAGPRFSLAAPLGTGLAAIGLAGLLLGSGGLPSMGSGATSAAASPAAAADASNGAGGAGAAALPQAEPSVTRELDAQGGAEASAAASAAPAAEVPAAAPASGDVVMTGEAPGASPIPVANAAGPAESPAASRVSDALASAAAGAAPSEQAVIAPGTPSATGDRGLALLPGTAAPAKGATSSDTDGAVPALLDASSPMSAWLVLSAFALAAGVVIVLLRVAARRLTRTG